MVLFNSSKVIPNTGNLLRNRRKRLIPYKGKWQQTFNEQQAMEALKRAASESESELTHPPTTTTTPPSLLSTLINSFDTYACDPTPSAYSFLVKTLTHNSQFDQLPPILDRIQNVEKFDPPEQIFAFLIRSYGYANRVDDAIQLFFRIPSFRCTPSAISLNALLFVLCRRKETLYMVHQVLLKSLDMNIRLEESSFGILINALCRIKRIGYAIEILKMMPEFGYEPDSALYSLILAAMCKIRDIPSVEVLGFLEEKRQKKFFPDEVDYANVIGFLVKVGKVMDALVLLDRMKIDGFKPDVVVYTSVLYGVISAENFDKAEELFDEMLVLGVVPNVHTYNTYLNGLCMQNKFEAGFKLMVCMEELDCKPDVSTYNTLMRGLCNDGKVKRAKVEVLRKMKLKGVEVNLHTYSILLDGLICEGEIEEACKMFDDMLNKRFVPMSFTCDKMIRGLCEREMISEALLILKQIVKRGIIPAVSIWEALLSASKLSWEKSTSLYLVLS